MRKSGGKAVRYNKWGYIFLIPFIVVYVVFQLVPLITTIYNSFFENYMSGLTQIGPNFVGFENYEKLFTSGDIWQYFKNTMVLWIMCFIPQIFLSLLLGAWFSDVSLKLKGTRFFKTVIYLPNLIMAGMLGIDTSLFEAAEVDGATSTQVFFKITLPLLRPILIYVIITSLIGGLQLFDVPQILTNGTGNPVRSSMTLIMYLNKRLYSKDYGMSGALSVILFIITAILSIAVFKLSGNDDKRKE